MARENNFLLGNGERMTESKAKVSGGGGKNPPYDFFTARKQISDWLNNANRYFEQLPNIACPNDLVTAVLTMHPRYISKTDFPKKLLDAVCLRSVGGRAKIVTPRQWGVKNHPSEAMTDEIFIMGTRATFSNWAEEVLKWTEDSEGSEHLTHLENLYAFQAEDKIRKFTKVRDELLLEVVMHEPSDSTLELFEDFVLHYDAKPLMDKLRRTKGLVFIPVLSSRQSVDKLAKFAYVRVVREMPRMRPLDPGHQSEFFSFPINLPNVRAVDPTIRVAIFDGGIPEDAPELPWVRQIEPVGIGKPVPEWQQHGLAVTSAFLFGPLRYLEDAPQPLCNVDHIRVLDHNSGIDGDFEYYDVLDRILYTLDNTEEPYHFINISMGPNIPIDDDEVTRWTSSLDELFVGGKTLATIASGNTGLYDAESGLNRIQPPADAVNALAIGACNSDDFMWMRADYSSVGPGRSPGVMKPDGVAFGGNQDNPFMVLAPIKEPTAEGSFGTSLASPFALRTAVSLQAQLGEGFSPLASRAMIIHRAEKGPYNILSETGWGKFITDYDQLITCENDEALVVYQDNLLIGSYLRAEIPLPEEELTGEVFITATLIIAPEVDPSYPNAYTRGGLEVVFRPDHTKLTEHEDGEYSTYAKTDEFFNQKTLYKASEFDLRRDGHKWETCLKATKKYESHELNKPCFDIYFNHRDEGHTLSDPNPISYVLVVSVKVPKISNFYDRVYRAYSNILVPLRPQTRITIKNNF